MDDLDVRITINDFEETVKSIEKGILSNAFFINIKGDSY
jgi:hypothetical protein